jgi:hypothetical protein
MASGTDVTASSPATRINRMAQCKQLLPPR